jgi:hypothetical protein
MYPPNDYTLIILLAALGFSVINLIALYGCYSIFQRHKDMIKDLLMRISYMEIVVDHYGLVPLPWEIEGFKDFKENKESRCFKQEGNVVYLKD